MASIQRVIRRPMRHGDCHCSRTHMMRLRSWGTLPWPSCLLRRSPFLPVAGAAAARPISRRSDRRRRRRRRRKSSSTSSICRRQSPCARHRQLLPPDTPICPRSAARRLRPARRGSVLRSTTAPSSASSTALASPATCRRAFTARFSARRSRCSAATTRWRQGEQLPVSIPFIARWRDEQPSRGHTSRVSWPLSRGRSIAGSCSTPRRFVANTHAADFVEGHDDHVLPGVVDEHADHDDTLFMGLGGRAARSGRRVFVAGEYTPRLAGLRSGPRPVGRRDREAHQRRRAHAATQLHEFVRHDFGQIARGGNKHDIYLGFNITRKF